MFYSNENIKEDYLREKFDIYNNDNCMRNYTLGPSGSIVPIIEMLDLANKAYKELLSSNDFKKLVSNTKPANTLIDSEISKSKLYDDSKYGNMGMPCKLEETELENIKSGKTLLRVNEKNHKMIYTVSKSGDWYIFKNFSPTKGSFGHERNVVKLLLRSIWCVKRLSDAKQFNTIVPGVTTMSDVINIDPSFRYFEEKGIRYSTHTFADKGGARISIEYKKDSRGVYRVSNIIKVKEGWNLLPYLLPIDRKLIDPNYDEASVESEEKTMLSESDSNEKSGSCTIV